jgi:hypothetical protein
VDFRIKTSPLRIAECGLKKQGSREKLLKKGSIIRGGVGFLILDCGFWNKEPLNLVLWAPLDFRLRILPDTSTL